MHALITTLAIAFSMYFPKIHSLSGITLIVMAALAMSTFFISLQVDIAESIQILYLLDQDYLICDRGDYRLQTETQGVSMYRSGLAI